MITIAEDAMGGDKAPASEVDGAIQAAREYGLIDQILDRRAVGTGPA